MKKKIIITDNLSGAIKTKVLEVTERAKDHLLAQQRYKASITVNKKKVIPRKRKHKEIDE